MGTVLRMTRHARGELPAGTYHVTAVVGNIKGTADLRVVVAALNFLEISPDDLTVGPGDKVTYTVFGFDQFANAMGDLTKQARFSVSEGGSCEGNVCSAQAPGSYFVDAAIGDVRTFARLVIHCPTEEAPT